MMRFLSAVVLSLFLLSSGSALALEASEVPKKRLTPQNLYLSPAEAHQMVSQEKDKLLFVDVRTRVELQYFGIADGVDANIPYYYVDQWNWTTKHSRFERIDNKKFISTLDRRLEEKGLSRADKIVFICKSGSRSKLAAKWLYKKGFKNIYIIPTGFDGNKVKEGPKKGQRIIDGWKNDGLPWTYKLKAEQIFLPEELAEATQKAKAVK